MKEREREREGVKDRNTDKNAGRYIYRQVLTGTNIIQIQIHLHRRPRDRKNERKKERKKGEQ